VNWPGELFSCNSDACERPCCAGSTLHDGIPLTVDDLLRLSKTSLLAHARGHFLSQTEAVALLRSAPTPGRLRRSWPRLPLLAVDRARCIFYDGATRRCCQHDARPGLCRSFPYELGYDDAGKPISASFAIACSLVASYGHNARTTPVTPANRKFRRALPVLEGGPYAWSWRPTRPSKMDAGNRAGVQQCLAQDRRVYGSVFVIAQHLELLTELGLERFIHPDDRPVSAQSKGASSSRSTS